MARQARARADQATHQDVDRPSGSQGGAMSPTERSRETMDDLDLLLSAPSA